MMRVHEVGCMLTLWYQYRTKNEPMKKRYSTLFFGLATIIVLTSGVNDETGQAGATGSPGEQTCNQSSCHTGTVVNAGGGTLELTSSNMTNWEYVPGQTYTFSVTVAEDGRGLFGVGLECLKSNGDNAGTLTPGLGSQIKLKTVSGFQRRNIVHTENGGESPNEHTWTFTWTAPATDEGDLTIYAAGNATNGNGSANGDHIYNISQVITPANQTAISELDKLNKDMALYPNPATDFVNMDFNLIYPGNVTVSVYTLTGLKVADIYSARHAAGLVHAHADVTSLATGHYLLQVISDNKVIAQSHLAH